MPRKCEAELDPGAFVEKLNLLKVIALQLSFARPGYANFALYASRA